VEDNPAVVMDGYIRVSRVAGRSGDSYISPSVQRDSIARWAEYKNVQIAAWHVDEDQSGGSHTRPGLEQAVQRALDGQTGGIVCARIDRFSRRTELGLKDLRRLESVNARLAFVAEDIDTGTVYGKMIYTILLAVSEAFLENIKASWIIAKERAVERGAFISRTPWGYVRNDDSTLSPHPQRAPIIHEAFRLAAAGSLDATLAYLRQVAPERNWNTTKVRRLLSQRSYLGETRNGEMVATGTHDAIVSRSIWEAAQGLPLQTRSPKGAFPLSGIPTCESCGAPMVGSRGGKQQRAYRCAAGLTFWCGQPCPRPPLILADRLEQYVIEQARPVLAGIKFGVATETDDRTVLLDRALSEAEAELDAFAGDLTMRRALGDRYHQHLASRSEAVEQAAAALREHAKGAQSPLSIDRDDLLSLDDPPVLGLVLRSIFRAIVVRPGRGLRVDQRVRIIPADRDPPAGVADPEQSE
jgi:DNA invertase Pin-like site-specific DNA recombinase